MSESDKCFGEKWSGEGELGCAGGGMQRHSFINARVGHLCVAFLGKGLNLWL